MEPEFAARYDALDDTPSFTLHPVRGVVWAAFWGSLIAAGIIMAINYSRMGRHAAARITVVVAVMATAALCALIFAIPEDVDIPNSAFVIPQLIVAYAIANALQGDDIRDHSAQGGIVASAWPSVGIGLLCLPFVLGAIFGIAFLVEPSYGTVIEFGNDEVYYAGDATEEDARELARVLQEVGCFGSGGVSVRLESSSARYTVSFVLVEDAWDDPEIVLAFSDIGNTLTESGLPTPLVIQLCDECFAVQKTLTIE
jgi:hypothetical protein